jgi:hypothetical protein
MKIRPGKNVVKEEFFIGLNQFREHQRGKPWPTFACFLGGFSVADDLRVFVPVGVLSFKSLPSAGKGNSLNLMPFGGQTTPFSSSFIQVFMI